MATTENQAETRVLEGREDVSIGVERYFTQDGVTPFEAVQWETRTAMIPGKDGPSFEQKDVEFPSFWSQTATNIVAQKYFRGKLNTPQREHSVRQMIGRVADTVTAWGIKDSYFLDQGEADTFHAELTHLLLHQMVAFNSPVWFNVGFEENPQCSACQPYRALVSTPDGMVPIGELVENQDIGREVYDASGTTRVVAVKANGKKPVWRVTLRNGSYVEATPDHVVKAVAERRTTPQWLRVDQLVPGMRLHLHPHRARVAQPALVGAGSHGLLDEPAEPEGHLVAEAALAGWLQADGFVEQYDGTNRSLTIEFMTANDDEFAWVTEHLDTVFPDVHRHVRDVETQNPDLTCRRIRLYGEVLRPFVEEWGLMARGTDISVPGRLWSASTDEVAAYLQSIFQADGYVSLRREAGYENARVEFAVIGERWVEQVQLLLGMLGIHSRRFRKSERREDRHDLHVISVAIGSERARFTDLIGFIGRDKQAKLIESLSLRGPKRCGDLREEEIVSIEPLGVEEVYDIQTTSGEYLSNNIAVHNCFILSVEDSMDSILDWINKEGRVFRGGSGSGINLSKLRSSKEQLSKGGYASGPVSFMRGADASAGTIKSGGKTRRAAKMVVLNVDHPDIEEFIWCKQREEEKARVLQAAGYDMSLDSPDWASIQYQNANNSVRVTDEFMRAVIDDEEWQLTARTDGSVVSTLRARDLMHQISEAAWKCADPGMHYDTTMNDWHTCPASGRINASNPCSEYLHVDNSACNLASLNLMKFRDPETLEFQVERFERAVDMIFMAQEILVSNSSYPTEEITRNAKAMRQLGLGYANLGALLMARGFPYDSDEGRAYAAAITAIMTGRAYRKSAEMAGRIGPFEEYPKNADAMLRVIRKHRAAVANIDAGVVPDEMMTAARRAWDEALAVGEANGYRNAQATVLAPTGTISFMMDCDTTGVEPDFSLVKSKKLVGGGDITIVNQTVPTALSKLGYAPHEIDQIVAHVNEHNTVVGAPGFKGEHMAVFDVAVGDRAIHHMGHVNMMAAVQPFISGAISKCVVGDSLVATTDGLVRIGSLRAGEMPDTFRTMRLRVASLDGIRETDAFYYGGLRETIEVVLRSGHRIVGTPNHRLLVSTPERGIDWRRLDELDIADNVAIQYGDDLWSNRPAQFDDFQATPPYGSQKHITVPSQMSEELAFFLGAYAAEGFTSRTNHTVRIANTDEGVIVRLVDLASSLFGIDARVARQGDRCPSVELSSKTLVEFLDFLGCGDRAVNKRIPDAVLRSPRPMVLSFLEGLSLDCYLPRSVPKWAICLASTGLLDDLQAVLTNLGVVHSRIAKYNAEYDRHYDEVYASGRHAQDFVRMMRFPEPHKAARAAELALLELRGGTADLVPGISGRELYDLIPRGRSGRSGAGTGRQRFCHLMDQRTTFVSRTSLDSVATVPGVELPDWLETVLDRNLHFSPVSEIGDSGEHEVFDVSVPGPHAFVANGIVNHNTVNLPNDVTVDDVAGLYLDAWKLGVKAIAIYRDGCKVAQPLSGKEKTPELIAAKPQRRVMPIERQEIGRKFKVGEYEGYIHVGLFPEGDPGDVFVDIAKEGTTLAGLMNAFMIAVSVGIQYGVPLEVFVSKFAHMRFEPSGLTNDPDIRVAKSIPDYIFRWMGKRFLDAESQADLGIMSQAVRDRMAAGYDAHAAAEGEPAAEVIAAPSPGQTALFNAWEDAVECAKCGGRKVRTGACYTCRDCGDNSGCG
jgi:ribonucleoside-diphosphate reductase alpha chain